MVARTPKVPRRPPVRPLTTEPGDIIQTQPVLWRIHSTTGVHALPWNSLRTFGPLPGMRWEPHPEPLREHPDHGVMYTALDTETAVAEVFQNTRTVAPTPDRRLTSWTPLRPLQLLDLTGRWPLRNHAAAALQSAPKPVCTAWARAIHDDVPDIDGIRTRSTITGNEMIVLVNGAAATFPRAPGFSEPLDSPMVWKLLSDIAHLVQWTLRSP